MQRIVLLALLAMTLLLTAPARPAHADGHSLLDICGQLQERALLAAPDVAFVVIDLRDDIQCSLNADAVFRSASLYKLVVMAEAYDQAERGVFSFDERLQFEDRHYVDDLPSTIPEELPELSAGEALRLMIELSDNASAEALRERLAPFAVAAALDRLGMDTTALGRVFVTTPADIARFFAMLYRGEVVSAEASAEMLAVLREQRLNDLIPQALPAGTEIAHKTGRLDRYLHDAGIVYAPGGDYVTVLMTRWQDDVNDSYVAIFDLTELLYAAFDTPVSGAEAQPSPPPTVSEATPGEPDTVGEPLAPDTSETSPAPAVEEGGTGSGNSEVGSAEAVATATSEVAASTDASNLSTASEWWRRPVPLAASLTLLAFVLVSVLVIGLVIGRRLRARGGARSVEESMAESMAESADGADTDGPAG